MRKNIKENETAILFGFSYLSNLKLSFDLDVLNTEIRLRAKIKK